MTTTLRFVTIPTTAFTLCNIIMTSTCSLSPRDESVLLDALSPSDDFISIGEIPISFGLSDVFMSVPITLGLSDVFMPVPNTLGLSDVFMSVGKMI